MRYRVCGIQEESEILANLFSLQFFHLNPRNELTSSTFLSQDGHCYCHIRLLWAFVPLTFCLGQCLCLFIDLKQDCCFSEWTAVGDATLLCHLTMTHHPHPYPPSETEVHRAHILPSLKVAKPSPRFLDTQLGHCPFSWASPLWRSSQASAPEFSVWDCCVLEQKSQVTALSSSWIRSCWALTVT